MNVVLLMFLSFAMIIGELFLDALVVFFNSSFKFAGMFSLFITLYTSFSIDESIRSSSRSKIYNLIFASVFAFNKTCTRL